MSPRPLVPICASRRPCCAGCAMPTTADGARATTPRWSHGYSRTRERPMEPTASSELHAEVTGTGEPAILLVHAGIADCRMWDQQVAVLARRHRVVRYDVR